MQGPLCHSANGNSPAWVSLGAVCGWKRNPTKSPAYTFVSEPQQTAVLLPICNIAPICNGESIPLPSDVAPHNLIGTV